jgi:hypothetical protein
MTVTTIVIEIRVRKWRLRLTLSLGAYLPVSAAGRLRPLLPCWDLRHVSAGPQWKDAPDPGQSGEPPVSRFGDRARIITYRGRMPECLAIQRVEPQRRKGFRKGMDARFPQAD